MQHVNATGRTTSHVMWPLPPSLHYFLSQTPPCASVSLLHSQKNGRICDECVRLQAKRLTFSEEWCSCLDAGGRSSASVIPAWLHSVPKVSPALKRTHIVALPQLQSSRGYRLWERLKQEMVREEKIPKTWAITPALLWIHGAVSNDQLPCAIYTQWNITRP